MRVKFTLNSHIRVKIRQNVKKKGKAVLKRTLILAAFAVIFLNADMIISPNALPENVQNFIKTHFKAQVGLVQMDRKSYEIYLTDGTELEFDLMGNWKEIENDMAGIDFSVLPPNLASIIQATYPNTALLEVKRKMNYYKIKLSNRMKIHIDANGTILGQKYDD